jgi:predicted Zn-dependent protease
MHRCEKRECEARDGNMAMGRRAFLALGATAGAAAVASSVTGCATNPVTGESQLMFMSEGQEITLDRESAPHQFSLDYGAFADANMQRYVTGVGQSMQGLTHRPQMPYNYRVLNAVVVNGYTFPAGSIGLARGLMLAMENEAQLAAVLGHELGHVNARHAGERMTKSVLAQAAMAGLAIYMEEEHEKYAGVAAGLGAVGANLLLARYSRSNERQADQLGMHYMTKAGHNPVGMQGLMKQLMAMHRSRPSAVDLLFATHPMSDERYDTAVSRCHADYAAEMSRSLGRERYMDNTAPLRAGGEAIRLMQKGNAAMMQQRFVEAQEHLLAALEQAPEDYTALLMLSKCYLAQGHTRVSEQYARRARAINPREPQALHMMGMAQLEGGLFESALAMFSKYERQLPGNDGTIYLKGLCHEKAGQKLRAVQEYRRFINAGGGQTPPGNYVNARLNEWGYGFDQI